MPGSFDLRRDVERQTFGQGFLVTVRVPGRAALRAVRASVLSRTLHLTGLIRRAVQQPNGAVAPDGLCDHEATARGSFGTLDSTNGQSTEMPIPELEVARVMRLLDKFCDRVPVAVRSELAYVYRFEGNTVLLSERRPHYKDRTRHTELAFAKFVYSPRIGGWSLRWSDRNGWWHRYDGFENVPQFREVLREVEADPTCIFFG